MYKKLIIIALLLTACNKDTYKPTGLMVEFIRQPERVLIVDAKPEFSWIVPSNVNFQKAYQIQISTSAEKLKNNKPDVWDSNKIVNNNSINISYNGQKLSDFSTYFWRVKIWDSNDVSSSFSEIQSFKTGKLKNYATSNNVFINKHIKPEEVEVNEAGNYFIDFGKDAFGTLLLKNIQVKVSDTIIVHLGEKSIGNQVDKDPNGSIRYQKTKLILNPKQQDYTLHLQKNKRNTSGKAIILPDSVGVIIPFRYCEIENFNGELKPANINQQVVTSYFEDDASYFTSSDTILNEIWDLCKYTIKATSFAGLYVDGDRERIPYEADAYINQLGHYYTDREFAMARQTNEYFISNPTWPTEWILHTVPMFYNDLMFTGNIESIAHYYNELKEKTLLSLAREDGLISSRLVTDSIMKKIGFSNDKERIKDIVDWPPAQKDTGWKLATINGERDGYELVAINTVVNAFHYQNLKQMSAIAGFLNKTKDSVFYQRKAIKVKNTINTKLIDSELGIYIDGESSKHASLHANMFPLAFDLVPEKNKKKVIEFIKSRGMACSVYGAQYLLEGLYKAGEADYALKLLTAKQNRSWFNMIKSGSTITMEAWDIKYKPNTDWNHAWGAAPANIIPMGLWGISPAKPGYAKAIIKPQFSVLNSSEIKVPTIRGSIKASYKNEGNSQEFNINLPGNMACDFIFPILDEEMVYLNDQRIENYDGMLSLLNKENKITIKHD